MLLQLTEFQKETHTYEKSRLMTGCNKFIIPNILCLWSCAEYLNKVSYIEMEITIQSHLPKSKLTLCNNHTKHRFIKSSRDDYIRTFKKCNTWHFYPCWCIQPSVSFLGEKSN